MKNKEIEQEHNKSVESLKKYAKEHGFEMPEGSEYKLVAIGYLSIDEEFEKGEVSTNFLTKLKVLWGEGISISLCDSSQCFLISFLVNRCVCSQSFFLQCHPE